LHCNHDVLLGKGNQRHGPLNIILGTADRKLVVLKFPDKGKENVFDRAKEALDIHPISTRTFDNRNSGNNWF